jgi:hypothetical protein
LVTKGSLDTLSVPLDKWLKKCGYRLPGSRWVIKPPKVTDAPFEDVFGYRCVAHRVGFTLPPDQSRPGESIARAIGVWRGRATVGRGWTCGLSAVAGEGERPTQEAIWFGRAEGVGHR